MNLRPEEESESGVATQEPAPPIQENLGFEAETVSGTATQKPTPLKGETLELVEEKELSIDTIL